MSAQQHTSALGVARAKQACANAYLASALSPIVSVQLAPVMASAVITELAVTADVIVMMAGMVKIAS
jgi:hypothetical protein